MDPGRLAIIHWLRLPKMSMISCYLGVIDGCSNSDNGCDSIPKICAGSSQTKFQQIGKGGHKFPPLAEIATKREELSSGCGHW